MCVAGLNVAVGPCHHRWYELVRPCNPGSNLSNCPNKLQLQGWENRNETCPWCDGSDRFLHRSTHRLFGSTPQAGCPVAGTSTEPNPITRTDRSGSIPTLSSFSRRGSNSSSEMDNAVRHREMNNRLHIYLHQSPHKILPSASKNYPTYDNWYSGSSSTATSDEASALGENYNLARRSSIKFMRRSWRKSVQLTKGMFNNP